MKKKIHIDFVSDVACPWCAVGLGHLEKAMAELVDQADIEIHFRPFELNPDLKKGGMKTIEHLAAKYGSSAQEIQKNQINIRERARLAGFHFNDEVRPYVYNTFSCHRLLHWALIEHGPAAQHQLKRAFLETYFCRNEDLDEPDMICAAVERAGLDSIKAREIYHSDQYAIEVRQMQEHYRRLGINAVPSIILQEKYLLQGAQPIETFISAIRELIEQPISSSP